MAPWAFLLAVAALTILVDAIPTISYPINAQVPPVARVSELFSYSFSTSTFTSTSRMTYTLLDAPSWLSLESSTRTLSGTPSSSDAGADVVTGVPFGLIATDATGSITQNVTLVVSKNPAPVNSIPVSTQLQTFGLFSAPFTLLYHPSTSFSLNFSSETFTDNSTSLSYYAVSLNYTPLPSWVTFDSESLSFAGRTPDYQSLIQPPQNFGFRLIASDVQGFSGTSATFEIEVGVHLFAFSKEELQANATPGVAFNFTGLADNLQLDGTSTDASTLSSIIAKTPSWLMFNNSTLELTGTPPADAAPENITVFATDIYGDVANATVYLDIDASLFNREIRGINATIGEDFSYSFGLYLKNSSDVKMTAQISPQTPWLAFDSQNFTLYGQVPPTIEPSNITITLTANSKTFRNSASQSFELAIIAGVILPSSTSTPTDASATPSKSATNGAGHRGLTNGQIAAIVVPTVFVIIALLVCIFLCCRRRRAKERPESPQKEMSRPIEARESLAIGPSSIREPTKLHLDTSESLVDRNPKGYTNSPMGGVKRNADGSVRRSQTMSAVSGAHNSAIRDSQSSENKTRSYSENALSRTDDSRRSTQGSANQDGAYPRIGSGTSSSNRLSSNHNYSLSRNYSNYSRKGHTRRSTRGGSSDRHVKDSNLSLRPSTGASILNLADSSFSSTPLDNFSVLSNNSSMQHTPEFAYIPTGPRRELPEVDPTKRYSRLITSSDIRRGGIGHGVRDTMPPALGGLAKRRSVGHGQERASTSGSSNAPGNAFASDSTGWQTVNTNEERERRYSIASNFTESMDVPYVGDSRYMGIRPVPKSPKIPPSVIYSESSATSRPLSRRTVGTSPFFGGGGSSRASRKSSKPLKEILYADSPTVPEESAMASQEDLEQSIMHSLRRQSTQRDSFGISYGSAREGTDRLRSFIQTRMDRTRTEDSMQSSTSRDSRFESAYTDDQDDPGSGTGEGQVVETPGAEWEDYLPEDYSDGSVWESQPSPRRDSKGNIIEYAPDDSPHVEQAEAAAAPDKAQLLESSSDSGRMSEIVTNTRLMPGPGRRPVSVDTEGKRGASHNASHSMGHIDQEDYTAYI